MENLITFINQYTRLDKNAEKALQELVEFESYNKNHFEIISITAADGKYPVENW
ncbi:MAG: hypothetical protein JW723_07845 [Bacteroidales bacterium]|nr:hypothetical protein [Bacteroidales bacterium]